MSADSPIQDQLPQSATPASTAGGPPPNTSTRPAIISTPKLPSAPPSSSFNTPTKPDINPCPPPPPTTDPKKPSPHVPSRPQPPDSLCSEPELVTIPSYSSWYSWNNIHECEMRFMPEFFDGKSLSKNPSVYKYYRNSIIKNFRSNPSKKITFTEVRRTIIGDVGAIRRVFDFLENWGLINYSPSTKQAARWEEKDGKSTASASASQAGKVSSTSSGSGERLSKVCNGCKTPCSIACFVCDKRDLVLCARCYVRGNHSVGFLPSEFRRVEISEPAKTDWTERETLLLLEAIMHYGADWTRVAQYVGGRTEKECVALFVKLPFGEQFVEPVHQSHDDKMLCQPRDQRTSDYEKESYAKRMRLSPLADASNPIMAQTTFLSALAGIETAEAAAKAAVAAIHDMGNRTVRGSAQTQAVANGEQDPDVNGNHKLCVLEDAQANAESLLKEEEGNLEQAVSNIGEMQMRELEATIVKCEEREAQLEREWQQLQQMKQQLFMDKLELLFHETFAPKSGENPILENV